MLQKLRKLWVSLDKLVEYFYNLLFIKLKTVNKDLIFYLTEAYFYSYNIYRKGTLKKNKRNKKALQFTEGWIEFLSKRVAKHVAVTLNNTRIGEHKKSKYYDHLWNLKYLPRFKWVHLNERLEYERAVFKQRMRAEIAQAKREASHFANTIDQHELFKKTFKKSLPSTDDIQFLFKQRQTDEEIKRTKKSKNIERESRTQFLKSLFGNE
uniref:Activator of basal transcription 1 n=1 Tax=Clastoptera arizonana TaxID=38151 RepID=A0A1B6E5E0_9HEMI